MTTLTDKYVHAVTRALPEEQRADVADELRATVADRIDALLDTDGDLDRDAAEYAAIAELDDPIRMTAGYTERPLHLIGPAVFPAYVRLMRVLAATVLPIVAVVTLTVGVLDNEAVGAVIGGAAWTTLNAAVHLAFWVTLVWVLVERNLAPKDVATSLGATWKPDDLPEPPRASAFPIGETVASVVLLLGMVGVVIGQHFWSWHADGTDAVPMLDPELWNLWLLIVVNSLLALIALEFVKLRVGHWTVPLAVTNTALRLVFAVPLIWLAATDTLLNPDFVAQLPDSVTAGSINNTTIVALVVITLWDLVDCWRKVSTPAMLAP